MVTPSLQDRIIARLRLLGIPSQRLTLHQDTDTATLKAINWKKYNEYRESLRVRREHDIPAITTENRLIKAPIFLPSLLCVICQKSIQQTGGRRIIAQHLRGIIITNVASGGGDSNYPRKSYRLSNYPLFLCVWGRPNPWHSEEVIERATTTFHKGRRNWFCQVCGNRVCNLCGYPQQFPVGSQLLYDDGSSSYLAMLPISPGCINPSCIKHRRRDHER
jgi:hypothetical protein